MNVCMYTSMYVCMYVHMYIAQSVVNITTAQMPSSGKFIINEPPPPPPSKKTDSVHVTAYQNTDLLVKK